MQLAVYGDNLSALVTAGTLAAAGHQVCLVPDNPSILTLLNADECPFQEPDLPELLRTQTALGRLTFSASNTTPVEGVFLALHTNALERAEALVDHYAAHKAGDLLIVNQTTFPVGTTEALHQRLTTQRSSEHAAEVVYLPELIQEGAAVEKFMHPDRLVVGCASATGAQRLQSLFSTIIPVSVPLQIMSHREAEFAKLAINGMLALRLSFMNDLANVADTYGVDIEQVRQALGADPRIGEAYLFPGCGFGGLNFSRNVMRLASTLESSGMGSELLEQVLAINERQKEVLFRKLWQHYQTRLAGRDIAIWGVAFKPGTERIDNAPALRLLEALWAQDVCVHVHDPMALKRLTDHFGQRSDLILAEDPYEAVRNTDALLLVTDWPQYAELDMQQVHDLMNTPLLLDGRNLFSPDAIKQLGFAYYGVGRQ